MSGDGYIKGMDLALAMRAAATVFARRGTLAEALDAAASSIELRYARDAAIMAEASGLTQRSDKAPGDVVIGSVCEHEWERDPANNTTRCRKCKETHADTCNATLPFPGRCECGEYRSPDAMRAGKSLTS
jgi:hypothetical protein